MAEQDEELNGQWQNRIVGYGEEDPEQLLANPRNFRIHPKVQQSALEGSLDTVGWIDDVIVNQRTGFVLDGHLRVSLALRHDAPKVPVKYVDLSEEEEAIALATFDPITAMAAADKDKLTELLRDIKTDDSRLRGMLDDMAREQGLQIGDEPPEDPGPQIDRAAELQARHADFPVLLAPWLANLMGLAALLILSWRFRRRAT